MNITRHGGVGIVVAPARERGLKYHTWLENGQILNVAPARERGLK